MKATQFFARFDIAAFLSNKQPMDIWQYIHRIPVLPFVVAQDICSVQESAQLCWNGSQYIERDEGRKER